MILSMILAAFLLEIVNTSMGMMYGTILAPLLLAWGVEAHVAIPAILFSQALGAVGASVTHHRLGNARFIGPSADLEIAATTAFPALAAVLLGVVVAVQIPSTWVRWYILVVVLSMSVLVLFPREYRFTWWKCWLIGILAGFNKALSGGGYGPIASIGKIAAGVEAKRSVATNTLSELLVCGAGFMAYSAAMDTDLQVLWPLAVGAVGGGLIGPWLAKVIPKEPLRGTIGLLGFVAALWLVAAP